MVIILMMKEEGEIMIVEVEKEVMAKVEEMVTMETMEIDKEMGQEMALPELVIGRLLAV